MKLSELKLLYDRRQKLLRRVLMYFNRVAPEPFTGPSKFPSTTKHKQLTSLSYHSGDSEFDSVSTKFSGAELEILIPHQMKIDDRVMVTVRAMGDQGFIDEVNDLIRSWPNVLRHGSGAPTSTGADLGEIDE